MTYAEKLANNLKLLLKEKNMSQSEFARRCGVGKSTVTNWIRCYGEPTLSYICKMMEVLNCTFEELVD